MTEIEAAVCLLAATVVADGTVHPKEMEEFIRQVTLVSGQSVKPKTNYDQVLAKVLEHLKKPASRNPLELNENEIRFIAGVVTNKDLQITVMNAIFEISFSDDDYHDQEKEVVNLLRHCWDV